MVMLQTTLENFDSPKVRTILQMRKHIRSIKQCVENIYVLYPASVESDEVLLNIYKHIFGDITYREDTIKRAGRNLRQREPQRFMRSEKKTEMDNMYSACMIEEMR